MLTAVLALRWQVEPSVKIHQDNSSLRCTLVSRKQFTPARRSLYATRFSSHGETFVFEKVPSERTDLLGFHMGLIQMLDVYKKVYGHFCRL